MVRNVAADVRRPTGTDTGESNHGYGGGNENWTADRAGTTDERPDNPRPSASSAVLISGPKSVPADSALDHRRLSGQWYPSANDEPGRPRLPAPNLAFAAVPVPQNIQPMIRTLLVASLLLACSSCQHTGVIPQVSEEIESVQFAFEPGTDLGPQLTYSIEVLDGLFRYRFQADWMEKKTMVLSVDVPITHERSQGIFRCACALPKGYWDREIPCSDVVILWSDRFVVEVKSKDGAIHRVSTEGLDERLHAVFSDALHTLRRRDRFGLPALKFSIGEKEAEGPFEWRYIGPAQAKVGN